MDVVFMGTGAIGVLTLRALAADPRASITGVVTQPDRPAGRGLRVSEAPVKQETHRLGLPVLQPERIRDPDAVAAVSAWNPDFLIVMAYGQILPRAILEIPRAAALNLHASLLPRHRGASPIAAAIRAGDTHSGITVMHMAEGLDCGDIVLAKECPIATDETAGSLHDKLADLAPSALMEALDALTSGTARRTPQDEAAATHAPKLTRADARIDWSRSAAEIERHIRAMNPWPGAFTHLPFKPGKAPAQVKLFRAKVGAMDTSHGAPGQILDATAEGIGVSCGTGVLLLQELQMEGRKRMDAGTFLRGVALPPDMMLE